MRTEEAVGLFAGLSRMMQNAVLRSLNNSGISVWECRWLDLCEVTGACYAYMPAGLLTPPSSSVGTPEIYSFYSHAALKGPCLKLESLYLVIVNILTLNSIESRAL